MENGHVAPVVSDLVEKIRRSGKTRTQVALTCGVSERQVYWVLTGTRNLNTRILTKIASGLGYDVVLKKRPEQRA
jgi:transcriptional regulator with XRE-family HTH domain